MAFPVVLYGSEGEQFNLYTTEQWALGTQLVLQDGRKFRFASAGGTSLVVGDVVQSAAGIANHIDNTAVASAIGSISPSVTLGATSVAANLYAEGYAIVNTTPDGGRVYPINNHATNTGSAALVLNLQPNYSLIAAWTTSSRVSLVQNPYHFLITAPATPSGFPVGVAVSTIQASSVATGLFGWVATKGTATAKINGTWVAGNPVVCNGTASVLGPSTVSTQATVGIARSVSTGTWGNVQLTIDA